MENEKREKTLRLRAIADPEFLIALNELMERMILVSLNASACEKLIHIQNDGKEYLTPDIINKATKPIYEKLGDLIMTRCEYCADREFERYRNMDNYIPGAIFAKDLNEKLLLWYNLYTNKEYPDPDEEENSDD